jgi:acyl carrier protein
VQEVRRTALGSFDPEAVFSTIRATVAREHGVAVHAVVLIHPATLLRTSSGKVRRQACLDAYLDGSLLVIAQSVLCAPEAIDDLAPNGVLASSHPTAFGSLPAAIAPHGPDSTRVVSALELEQGAALRRRVEAHVFDWVARHRKVPVSQLDPRASISDWGVDSLARVDLVRSLEKLLGVSVSESDLHAVDSIDDLAQLMARLCLPDRDATSARILSEPASGEAAEQAPRTAASGTPRHIELPRFTPIKWD